jgi:vacuolar-type H+-ATPase subunit I/STV1
MYQRTLAITLALAMSAVALAKPPHAADRFGPGPGPGHPPAHGQEHRPMSPALAEELRAQEDELLDFIQGQHPEAAAELRKLRESNTDLYILKLRHIQHMRKMAQENPEAAALKKDIHIRNRELHELSRSYHESESNKEREQLEDEIDELATQIFEMKQRERSTRIDTMKKHIDKLKQEIKDRESDKEAIVDDFVQRMLTKKRDL